MEGIAHGYPFSFKKRGWNMAKFLSEKTTILFHDVLTHNGYSIKELLVKKSGERFIVHNLEPEHFCDGA